MIEDECGETCCSHGCNQGRDCPARQACEVPENVPNNFGVIGEWLVSLVIVSALFVGIAIAIFMVVYLCR